MVAVVLASFLAVALVSFALGWIAHGRRERERRGGNIFEARRS